MMRNQSEFLKDGKGLGSLIVVGEGGLDFPSMKKGGDRDFLCNKICTYVQKYRT